MSGSNALSDLLHRVGAAEIMTDQPPRLQAAAMYYASKYGWPVFPLLPRGKKPLTTHGFQDASRDVDKVRAWWTEHPEANIGLPTGPHEHGGIGLDVIDADGPEGVEAWSQLKHRACTGCGRDEFCNADGGFHVVCEAFTPGNSTVGKGPGRHVYVRASGRGNSTRLNGVPLDIRGAGGYVVAAPSVNLVGAAYTWLKKPEIT